MCKNLKFQAGDRSGLKEHVMFKWYMTENFSLKVLMYGFLLYSLT